MRKKLWPIGCASLILAFVLSFSLSQKSDATIQSFVATVEPVLEVSVPSTIDLNISEANGGIYRQNFQIVISTNNRTGYTFTGKVRENAARLSANNNSDYLRYFNYPLTQDYLQNQKNWWRISMSTDDPSEVILNYTTTSDLAHTDDPSIGDEYDFMLAASATTSISAGLYTGNIDFYITANPIPNTISYIDYLQEINNDVVMSMQPGKYYQLKDQRDGKSYWIVYQDGELKMAQNLDYDIASSVPLTPELSNVSEETTLASSTISGGTFESLWTNKNDTPVSYDEGIIYRPSSEDNYTVLDRCVRDGYSEWDCQRAAAGNYYNWSAAVATNDTSALTSGSLLNQSICPANWKLPETASANYLSSEVPSDKSAAGRIRCVGIMPTYTLTLVSNNYFEPATSEVVTHDAWGDYSFTLSNTADYTFDISHEFAGWSVTANANAIDFELGSEYPMTGHDKTLYAFWKDKELTLSDITKMQEITPTIIRNTPEGTSKQLIDLRDGKKYWVTKFGGETGDIWMTQNLNYDTTAGSTIRLDYKTSDLLTTNTNFSYTIASTNYDFDGGEYYIQGDLGKQEIVDFADDDERWHYHVGNYYSFNTAKLGVFSYKRADKTVYHWNGDTPVSGTVYDYYQEDSSYNTSYSICPKGWGLPTNRELRRLGYYSGNKYGVKGGYLKDYDVVTEEGTAAYYLSNSQYLNLDDGQIYVNESDKSTYFFDITDSTVAMKMTVWNKKNLAGTVRCIARKDIDVNAPLSRRLEVGR